MKPNKLKTEIDHELAGLLNGWLMDDDNHTNLTNLVKEVTVERDSFWRKQLILTAILDYIFEHLSELNRLQGDIPHLKEKIITAVNDEYSNTTIEDLQNSKKN